MPYKHSAHIHYLTPLTFIVGILGTSMPADSYENNLNCYTLYHHVTGNSQDTANRLLRMASEYHNPPHRHSASLQHKHRQHNDVKMVVNVQHEGILGDDTQVVSNEELSQMRGGFIGIGGMRLDFGLMTTTAVDGVIQNTLNLSSANIHGTIPTSLQQLIQTGQNNQVSTPANITNNVLTIVQNTANNKVIQNANVLNLTVNNINSIRFQQVLFNSISSRISAIH